MQVQRIQSNYNQSYKNNNQTSFGSKFGFYYRPFIGESRRVIANDICEVLRKGSDYCDVELLKAYKGLLNDGKENLYLFCYDEGGIFGEYLKVKKPTGTNIYYLPHDNQTKKISAMREMIVDIARNQGIILEKTEDDLKAEKELVQKELKEMKKLVFSDLEYKDTYIYKLKSIIKDKINNKYSNELLELCGTQSSKVPAYECSIMGQNVQI